MGWVALVFLAGSLFAAGEPARLSAPLPAIAAPTPSVAGAGTRHYIVQIRIIEVDEQGRQTVVAQPTLQTTGAASGVTIHPQDGRRLEFHFAASAPGGPRPLPVVMGNDALPRPILSPEQVEAQKVLDQRVSVKAVQQPRKDVLRDVAKQVGLKVMIEPELAAATANQLNAPVTLQTDQAPLYDVLDRLVEPLGLRYNVDREGVVLTASAVGVTTPVLKPAPSSLKEYQVRVYLVADLLTKPTEGESLNFAPILEQLVAEVTPQDWDKKGGKATARGFDSTQSLVIRHHTAGHEAVSKFLERLRKSRTDGDLPPIPQ